MILPRKQLLVMVLEDDCKGYKWRVIQGNCLLEQSSKPYRSFQAAYAAGQQMAELVIPIFPIAPPERYSISYGYMIDSTLVT
jgi:hypothetical protein